MLIIFALTSVCHITFITLMRLIVLKIVRLLFYQVEENSSLVWLMTIVLNYCLKNRPKERRLEKVDILCEFSWQLVNIFHSVIRCKIFCVDFSCGTSYEKLPLGIIQRVWILVCFIHTFYYSMNNNRSECSVSAMQWCFNHWQNDDH